MQPNQQQPEAEQWQQPTTAPSAAPYQAPVEPALEPSETTQVATAAAPAPDAVVETQDVANLTEPTTPESEPTAEDDSALLRWEGTEYIHSTRSVKWYIFFGITAILAIVLAIVVLKSVTFAILVPVMTLALIMYVRRPPEVLQYTLSRKGLHINDKLYTFDVFKAFGVVSHAGNHSIVLIPRKRFYIGQTIYFPEEVGEQVVDMLASRLPMQEVKPDAIDRLLAKLHL